MERCSKCGGIMLQMKIKKTVMRDIEKKLVLKCSRCGFYIEKQQVFSAGSYPEKSDNLYSARRRAP